MGTANKILTSSSFIAFLTEVSQESAKLLKDGNFDVRQRNAVVLIINTLRNHIDHEFSYLPEGDRKNIVAQCLTWLDIGMLIGKFPDWLADVLLKNKAQLADK
jgi:hypothetical protein